jgi:phage terminase large subunit-like protein
MAEKSKAEILAAMPEAERARFLATLSQPEMERLLWALEWDWDWNGRPAQQMPGGDWIVWLILAGRGFGKTRTGAETVRQRVKYDPYVNLIGATADDARDIMIEGESGILAICPPEERPVYKASKRCLEWPNGAKSLIFTADEPERLRGKQHGFLWGDELASWRYPDSWDQAMFGLRLGKRPQAIVTTTPRPTELVKMLAKSPTTYLTKGSTYDNSANLARTFLSKIVEKYEGTRLGRQELNAEILDDNPGALWKRSQIDRDRISPATMPALGYIAVGVDPAATSGEGSDETGIVVVGRDMRSPPHFYVLDDRTLRGTPDEWGAAAVSAYRSSQANVLIGETNQGGEMVEMVIKTKSPEVYYKGVHATRGKAIRAEPVSALYEQGRVHHVGSFPKMEDELCQWDPISSKKSPNRMDALVWAFYGIGIGGDAWAEYLSKNHEDEPEIGDFTIG